VQTTSVVSHLNFAFVCVAVANGAVVLVWVFDLHSYSTLLLLCVVQTTSVVSHLNFAFDMILGY
jgi:hypothetical protein